MAQSTIALLILLVTVILFVTEKIPLSLTAMLSAITMGLFGIMSWSDVFSGMSNSIIIFLVGCGILGASYFSTGLADKIGQAIMRMGSALTEKRLILFLYIIGAITSAFFNGAMIVAVLFPIIDAMVHSSNGRLTRKQLYLPTAVSTVFGSNMTTIGSTSMMLAVSLLASSENGYQFSFFEPLWIGLPGTLAAFLVYATFGCRMQDRIFNYPDIPSDVDVIELKDESSSGLTKHQWITVITTLACIGSIIFGLNYGAAGFIAASVLIVTGCIDLKHAYRSAGWEIIFLVAGSLGIAKGLQVSGAGQVIADVTLKVFSFTANSPAGLCIVILFLATLLSNFMSNGATVSIVVPIALSLAFALGTNPAPFVLAGAIGANLSVATPICVTQVTMSCSAGYNFRSLIRMGGFLNLVTFVVTAAALLVVYYI